MNKSIRNFTVNTPGGEKRKLICKECNRETSHLVLATCQEDGSQIFNSNPFFSIDTKQLHQIIQCQGCENVSFRVHHSEERCEDGINPTRIETEKYYPARVDGLKALDSYLLPLNVQGIYQETILAIENEQNILAGIGVRALVETICKDLAASGKDLGQKINYLESQSVVTKNDASTLHKLRVLGNLAAHEVAKHDREQLSLAIQIIEHMLHGTYIIPNKVSKTFKNRS